MRLITAVPLAAAVLELERVSGGSAERPPTGTNGKGSETPMTLRDRIGIAGFLTVMPTDRLEEVRVADNNGEYEVHFYPGEGIIDFKDMFDRVEATGFKGHYMNAFGSLDDRPCGRDDLVALCPATGP